MRAPNQISIKAAVDGYCFANDDVVARMIEFQVWLSIWKFVLCLAVYGCSAAILYGRPVQKLSSFSLKHYQIFFGNIFRRWLLLVCFYATTTVAPHICMSARDVHCAFRCVYNVCLCIVHAIFGYFRPLSALLVLIFMHIHFYVLFLCAANMCCIGICIDSRVYAKK